MKPENLKRLCELLESMESDNEFPMIWGVASVELIREILPALRALFPAHQADLIQRQAALLDADPRSMRTTMNVVFHDLTKESS